MRMRLIPRCPTSKRLCTYLVVKMFCELILIRTKEMLAVRGCMDAYGTNTDTGDDQCDEKRYAEIEFHSGPLCMPTG